MKQFRALNFVAASFFALAITVLISPKPANATLILWEYSGNFGSEGGLGSGSWVYDTVADSFSDVLVTTTGGTLFGAKMFSSVVLPNSSLNILRLTDPSDGPNFVGAPALTVEIGAFTFADLAAAVDLAFISTCIFFAGCTTASAPETPVATANSLTPRPIPEPSSLLLFGAGLIGVVGIGWRRRPTKQA